MANERIPNDPYRASNPADDPYRSVAATTT